MSGSPATISPRRIAVVCPRSRRGALAPLLAAYTERHHVDVHLTGERTVPDLSDLADIADGVDALLVVGWRARSPRTVLPGPAITASNDRRPVPVGWVPDVGTPGVERFATRAAEIHERSTRSRIRTMAVLGSRLERYEDLAERIERLVAVEDPAAAHRWTAGEQMMDDVLDGLGAGPAVVCYVGHGRPVGWAGYRGVRAHHLAEVEHPSALVLSFTCLTASRRRVGLSFAESLVMQGSTAACLGAVAPTDHQWNGRWAYRMCRELPSAETVGDVVIAAQPLPGASPYRLIGDPLAPLVDAPNARQAMNEHTARHHFGPDRRITTRPELHPAGRIQAAAGTVLGRTGLDRRASSDHAGADRSAAHSSAPTAISNCQPEEYVA